jgi:hypothetical protein
MKTHYLLGSRFFLNEILTILQKSSRIVSMHSQFSVSSLPHDYGEGKRPLGVKGVGFVKPRDTQKSTSLKQSKNLSYSSQKERTYVPRKKSREKTDPSE